MAKKILFMGDSITCAARNKEDPSHLGFGYAAMIAEVLENAQPGAYEVINRGINGNHIVDMYARMRRDIINHQPDYVSILAGVNGVLAEFERQDGISLKKFEKIYTMLIEELLEALPDAKIMILEPLVLPGRLSSDNEIHPHRWDVLSKEVPLRAQAAKRIAEKNNLKFVPLREVFEKANVDVPEDYLLKDGVHPTPEGYELIKETWLEAFREL